jgi:hypothetical protein
MTEQSQIERLAGLSSDGQERAPKYNPTVLKFNGNTGAFSTYNIETKEETPITDPVEITVLKRRKALSAWTSNDSHFTNEYNNTNQKVSLYKNLEGTVTHEATDTPGELRAKYPTLKTKEVVYCLFNGAVHKLDIKGTSLRDWWDFSKKLNEEDKHSFQIVTGISSVAVKEKGKIPYYKMVFENKGESDLDALEEPMKEVAEGTGKVDEYFARKIAGEFRKNQGSATAAATPAGDVIEYPADDINVDDIPF